jgi:hypothetical protein
VIEVCRIAVLGDKLAIAMLVCDDRPKLQTETYRVLLVVFLGVNVQTGCATRTHSLITILSSNEAILPLDIMNTLNNLGAD